MEKEGLARDGKILAQLLYVAFIHRENAPFFWKLLYAISERPQFNAYPMALLALSVANTAERRGEIGNLGAALKRHMGHEPRASKGLEFLGVLLKLICQQGNAKNIVDVNRFIAEYHYSTFINSYYKTAKFGHLQTQLEKFLRVQKKLGHIIIKYNLEYYHNEMINASASKPATLPHLKLYYQYYYCLQQAENPAFKRMSNLKSKLEPFMQTAIRAMEGIFNEIPNKNDQDFRVLGHFYRVLAELSNRVGLTAITVKFHLKTIQILNGFIQKKADDDERAIAFTSVELGRLFLHKRDYFQTEAFLRRALKKMVYDVRQSIRLDHEFIKKIYTAFHEHYISLQRISKGKPIDAFEALKLGIFPVVSHFIENLTISELLCNQFCDLVNFTIASSHPGSIKLAGDLLVFIQFVLRDHRMDADSRFLKSSAEWDRMLNDKLKPAMLPALPMQGLPVFDSASGSQPFSPTSLSALSSSSYSPSSSASAAAWASSSSSAILSSSSGMMTTSTPQPTVLFLAGSGPVLGEQFEARGKFGITTTEKQAAAVQMPLPPSTN